MRKALNNRISRVFRSFSAVLSLNFCVSFQFPRKSLQEAKTRRAKDFQAHPDTDDPEAGGKTERGLRRALAGKNKRRGPRDVQKTRHDRQPPQQDARGPQDVRFRDEKTRQVLEHFQIARKQSCFAPLPAISDPAAVLGLSLRRRGRFLRQNQHSVPGTSQEEETEQEDLSSVRGRRKGPNEQSPVRGRQKVFKLRQSLL